MSDSVPVEPPAKPMMFVPANDNQISVLLDCHARNFFGRVSRAYNGVGGNARVKLALSEFLQLLRVFMLQTVFPCLKVEHPKRSRLHHHIEEGEVSPGPGCEACGVAQRVDRLFGKINRHQYFPGIGRR